MRRRDFIQRIVGSATAWPLMARAQQGEHMRRIGVLMGIPESDRDAQFGLAALKEELRKLGWIEGRNIEMEIRWAGANVESRKRFAEELVALQPDLIVTSSTPATAAMLQQSRTIPVIFVEVGDPIGSGFVRSLAQPGGNVTGFTPIVGSLGSKWVEVLRDIAPRVRRVTLVFNPPTAPFVEGYLNPPKLPPRPLARRRLSAPLTTCPSSNPSLRHRHASQIVASSSYRTSSQSATVKKLFR